MEGLLKCPHGLVTGCEERQGLKIYRHLQDGEACGLLNGLQLTPEEILLEMGQTFVSSDNFTALAPYVRVGELAEGYVPPQASTAREMRCHSVAFTRSSLSGSRYFCSTYDCKAAR